MTISNKYRVLLGLICAVIAALALAQSRSSPYTLLSGFILFMFVVALNWPAIAGGIVLGTHGLLSNISYLTQLPWIALTVIAVLAGQSLWLVKNRKEMCGGHRLTLNNKLIFSLGLFATVVLIGVTGEFFHPLRVGGQFGELHEWITTQTVRDESNTTLLVLTRWGPYFLLAFLGSMAQGPASVLKFFSIAVLAKLLAIPVDWYLEQHLSQMIARMEIVGLDWLAINRAYLGYEACIAFLWFSSGIRTATPGIQRSLLTGLTLLAFIVVVFSWSKGPLIALALVLAIHAANFLKVTPPAKAIQVGFFVLVAACLFTAYLVIASDSLFLKKLVPSLRLEQSLQIRADILSQAAFAEPRDSVGWMFGRGFGWSRWHVLGDGQAVVGGSGTHIFLLDLLLDVGGVGALLFFSALFLLWRAAKLSPDKLGWSQFNAPLVGIFSLVLLIKLSIASDTYSEPLFAMLIGLLAGKTIFHERAV